MIELLSRERWYGKRVGGGGYECSVRYVTGAKLLPGVEFLIGPAYEGATIRKSRKGRLEGPITGPKIERDSE